MSTTLITILMALVGAINLVVYGCFVLASQCDEEMNLQCQRVDAESQPRCARL